MEVVKPINEIKNEVFYSRCRKCILCILLVQPISLITFSLLLNSNIAHPSVWLDNFSSTISLTMIKQIFIFWIFSMIIALIHINNLSVRDIPVSSKWNLIWRILRVGNLLQIIIYCGISGLSVWYYLSLLAEENTAFFSISDNESCMNEFPVFVICCGLFVGMVLGGRYFFHRLYVVKFPLVQQSKFLRINEAFLKIVNTTGRFVFRLLKYFCVVYVFLIGKPLMNYLTNLFEVSKICGTSELSSISGIFNWRLLFVTWFCCLYLYLSFQLIYLLFEVFITQAYVFPVMATTYSPISLPLALMFTEIPLVLYLSTNDLLNISQHKNDTRFNLIFSLSVPGGHAYNWKAIIQQCLQLQRQFINTLTYTEDSASNSANIVKGNPVVTMRADITKYKELRRIFTMSTWFRHKMEEMKSKLKTSPLVSFFYSVSDLQERFPRNAFSDCQTQIWIVQALSFFVISAIRLDKFGVIQAELMDIINLMIQLEQELDKRHLRCVRTENFQRDYFLRKSLSLSVKTSINRLAAVFNKQLDCLPLTSEQRRFFLDRGC